MKKLSLLFFATAIIGIASARVINIPTQPVSPFADTEVSTNLVIHPSRTDVRDVKIHLQLAGTAYNDLEIGFGRDVNTNGVLDVEEVETVYGWRGGRYFIENTRNWERIENEAACNAQRNAPVAEGDQVGRMSEATEPQSGRKSPRVVDIHLTRGPDLAPKSFAATCGISPERSEPRQRSLEGCETAFAALSTTPPPAWLFRNNWNMVRVVRRGAGTPSEWVRCEVGYNSISIRLR